MSEKLIEEGKNLVEAWEELREKGGNDRTCDCLPDNFEVRDSTCSEG